MPSETFTVKAYSPEELRLLAAEGRLKGRGVERLVNLRSGESGDDREIGREAFETLAARLPCWTDPLVLLRTFTDLVQIPSPPGDESQVATYLADRLREIGIEALTQDACGNIIATLPATSNTAPSLLFTAHMDCVYPVKGAPVVPAFCASGEIRTDRKNSLGADDKAGIAGILSALEYIRSARLPHGDIRVVFTVQEEFGYLGIKQVPANILNGIHLVFSMDPPVRVERNETAHLAVLHMPPDHPFVPLVYQAGQDCGLSPLILFAEDGYVGGDTICLSPLGANVVDFCSASRYPHTPHEHVRFRDLVGQVNWMVATVERVLVQKAADLELRAVYGDEPIGTLTGVRKQVPITDDLLQKKLALSEGLHELPGPRMAPVLAHLSAIAPRIGDPALLRAVVAAYGRCLRIDHVPQVLRNLTGCLLHLAANLGDVRALQPLIPAVQEIVQRGGDESARINALRFFETLFQKERRVAVRTRVLRTLILCLQNGSQAVADAAVRFFRSHLEDTIHALTVAFCSRERAGWERMASGSGRIVGGRSRGGDDTVRWTLLRQRILQLLLEEDRILPEMLEWIFSHDGAATQKIAVAFVDPSRTTHIADRILKNLKSRQPGIQETAVHFVGTHRMVQAVGPLVDLLLTAYQCRNRSLVEWALDAIGHPALDEVVGRLGTDADFAPFVRRMFNRHDTMTDADFDRLSSHLQDAYGSGFHLDDPDQIAMLSHYIGRLDLSDLRELSRWDKRRTIIFYSHISRIYPKRQDLERLAELLEDSDEGARAHFVHMAVQKNIFDDGEFLTLVSCENTRFLSHFVQLEKQIPRRAILARLRELIGGAQLDMSDPQDVEIYYLYLLKQSPAMPDRTRYLKHIQEARNHLFPPLKPYCRAFTIVGDRIEEVGTVDRERVKALVAGLPQPEGRRDRLHSLLLTGMLAKRERQRLVNGLSEAFAMDVSSFNALEDRANALLNGIDFEFDAAYRSVPQVVFPALLRVRMKHRADDIVETLADYAIEYALTNHPEIGDVLESGELDLVLDGLNDLLTDRVYEAERDLSEDVFLELHDKHVKALSQFYTSQWKGIVRDLKKAFPDGRSADLIEATDQAMRDYNMRNEDEADLLDTNLNRLVQVLRVRDPNLHTYHDRHRECYKVYAAVLRARNIRQLKRIYREVHRILQDEISYAGREHMPGKNDLPALRSTFVQDEEDGAHRESRQPAGRGYLKYARKELGKLDKLMSDFVLERALDDRVQTVQSEITKLRQIVIGTSHILCAPSKDVSIVYRSWPGNDCNTGDIRQVVCPDCSFYKIISDGAWKGYFTLVEIRRRTERALLLDVLNYSGLKMENENFIKVLMHQIVQIARANEIGYVLTSSYESHISNRDYIRRAFHKIFPPLGTVQGFALACTPTAHFQSLNPNLSVVWQDDSAA